VVSLGKSIDSEEMVGKALPTLPKDFLRVSSEADIMESKPSDLAHGNLLASKSKGLDSKKLWSPNLQIWHTVICLRPNLKVWIPKSYGVQTFRFGTR